MAQSKSSYQRHGKRPTNYRPMYARLLDSDADTALTQWLRANKAQAPIEINHPMHKGKGK